MIYNTNCRLLSCIIILTVHIEAIGQGFECPMPVFGGYAQGYGPYNYITQKDKLGIVEGAHFTTDVATLKSGKSGSLENDLDYTLRAFPNHHRALQSVADLALREKSSRLPRMTFSVPCYFIRASMFAATDGMVNAIYAYYLARIGQKSLAIAEAKNAIQKNPDKPRVAYNVGLAYFYVGDYKTAKEYAAKAKKLGSSAVGLDNLLSSLEKDQNKGEELKVRQ